MGGRYYDMQSTNFARIQTGYNSRVYTLKDLIDFVEKKIITKKEFHWITGYSYEGLKKTRGW